MTEDIEIAGNIAIVITVIVTNLLLWLEVTGYGRRKGE